MSINRNNTSETPKKAALYVRVSTNYQIDRDSLPMQRQELITYAQLMFGINDYVVFEDAGYSGKNTDRPEFQNMMRRIRAGEFTHLLCWKIDPYLQKSSGLCIYVPGTERPGRNLRQQK